MDPKEFDAYVYACVAVVHVSYEYRAEETKNYQHHAITWHKVNMEIHILNYYNIN